MGNGFDLSLGLKTKYSDFANDTNFWPFNDSKSGLGFFLNKKKEKEEWLDIEQCLLQYAKNPIGQNGLNKLDHYGEYSSEKSSLEEDKKDYERLKNNLTSYLKKEQQKGINKASVGYQVLNAILCHGGFTIYSFNYTDLCVMASSPGLKFSHVHGSIKDNNIVLGINSIENVYENYDFLYKDYKPVKSTMLIPDLDDAEEIVIFGCSLGNVDEVYFQDFFKDLCKRNRTRRHVTIFTKDDDSRLIIQRRLKVLTENRYLYLKNYNDFEILCTESCQNSNNRDFAVFLRHVSKLKRDKPVRGVRVR